VLWTDKYAPKGVEEFAGNPAAREEAVKWALDWKRGKKGKPLLVNGPTGTGKTALVRAVAASAGWGVVEVEEGSLADEERLKALFSSSPLYGGNSLVLIDAAESRFKQAQLTKLAAMAAQSNQPVVFTSEDAWDKKMTSVRAACVQVALRRVNWLTIKKVITAIGAAEGVSENFEEIAASSNGDLRSAINDLQAGSHGERDRKADAFESIRRVFKKGFAEAIEAQRDFDDWEMFAKWLQENVPREYDAEETAAALQWLSRADVFVGRIRRRQDYGMLRYATALAAGGVASAKREPHHDFVPYAFPTYIRAMSASRASRALLNSLAGKVAKKTHVSKAAAKKMLWFLPADSAEYFGFDEEEMGLLAELGVFEAGNGEKNKRKKG